MKIKQLIPFGIISSIALALPLASQALQPIVSGGRYADSSSSAALSPTSVMTAAQPTRIAASGTFVAAEKPTTGTARIRVENGKRYLVFDSGFSTSNQGPDLHVVLDPDGKPPAQYSDPTRFVNLGKLQKTAGEQRYPIPAAVDLRKFKSVGIWCRMANATFGYASFPESMNPDR